MKQLKLFTVFIILSLFISCGDKDSQNDDEINDQDSISIKKDTVSGVIQKGPFINGSTISIAEFDENFAPTGRKFDAQIMDNSGLFNIKNIELESQYAELKADGFYFNEVHGIKSSAQLTLYSLSDLSDKDTVNVNILSHLERGRMLSLIEEGSSFQEAKQKARIEVLKIFGVDADESVDEFDGLDISKTGTGNAILLAASVILQGNRDAAGLSELLADILTDIRTDGTLDSTSTISKIVTDLEIIDLKGVRTNLENRYKELNLNYSIPEFEKYVETYLNSKKDYTLQIPEEGKYGKNILYYLVNHEMTEKEENEGNCILEHGTFSINAIVPENREIRFFAGSECVNSMNADIESSEGWTNWENENASSFGHSFSFKNSTNEIDMKFELFGGHNSIGFALFDKETQNLVYSYDKNIYVENEEWDCQTEYPDDEGLEEPFEEEDDNNETADTYQDSEQPDDDM